MDCQGITDGAPLVCGHQANLLAGLWLGCQLLWECVSSWFAASARMMPCQHVRLGMAACVVLHGDRGADLHIPSMTDSLSMWTDVCCHPLSCWQTRWGPTPAGCAAWCVMPPVHQGASAGGHIFTLMTSVGRVLLYPAMRCLLSATEAPGVGCISLGCEPLVSWHGGPVVSSRASRARAM